MSFAEVVNQHWDQIHVLTQLCIVIAQSSAEREHANVEIDLAGDDGDPSEYSGDYNDRLMLKIANRVIALCSDTDHLSDAQCVFYWMSRRDGVELMGRRPRSFGDLVWVIPLIGCDEGYGWTN